MFPTSIDTVEAEGIRKTVLLQSSANTRLLEAPARIDFSFLQIAPDVKEFQRKNIPIALLLEGRFRSHYTGRVSRAMADSLAAMNAPFLSADPNPGKMIVVADGDIAMNPFSQSQGPLEMGTNVFMHYTYANKDFFLNAVDYLVNPTDILQTRSKEFTLRLLDPRKATDEKSKWQMINIALPIILVIIFGLIYQQARRYRFAR
jgi:gliding-associated putative ABC transporter substrate-binding component GldG